MLKYDRCYNVESNNCLSYFDIKYNHLKRFLICGPAPGPHLLPFLWAFQALTLSLPWRECVQVLSCVLVSDGPRAYFRLQQPSQRPSQSVRSPQRLLASAVAVHFIPCVTLATRGASQNIQSLVFCDTDNNQ